MLIKTLTLPAPAKLNRFLHIIGRREDGYHLLQTYFHLLDYGDELTLNLTDNAQIRRVKGNASIQSESDLVVRAALLLQEYSQCPLGVDISIHKRLPVGGGLGGGSSNAATVLVGLNQLWQCQLSLDELASLGQQLGADVPVFVYGASAWGEGIGEQLTPLPIADCWYLVVYPRVAVSTPEIFSYEGLTRNCQAIRIATFLNEQADTQNVFEPVVRKFYPEVNKVFLLLSRWCEAKLTGTGSCVFAQFDNEASARFVMFELNKLQDWRCFVAKSIKTSSLHFSLKLHI